MSKKRWFVVHYDEYSSESLPLGQLVSSIDEISHSLNRTTLIAPSEIRETFQASSTITVFKNHALQGGVDVSPVGVPAGLTASAGIKKTDDLTFQADVVQTQTFDPSDDYAQKVFQASKGDSDMRNYLDQQWFGRKNPVFMITGRKVGKAMTVTRNEEHSLEQKAMIGFNIEQAVTVKANLEMSWKKGLKIDSFVEEPCVFAVQLRRVLYDQKKPTRTENFVKGAVMGTDDGKKEEEVELESVFTGMDKESPMVQSYEYDDVAMTGPDGEEEEFLVETED